MEQQKAEVVPYDKIEPFIDYCHGCGHFAEINETSKICVPCDDAWWTRVRAIGSIVL